ncbi:MAG: PP2C family protein-serine/threonine phosphatase [Mogibacterium sp.]|nr:PP2C family protein-serine/threonine phosphatase [Mogibacterium sp.]
MDKKKKDNKLSDVKRSLGTKTFVITLALTMGIGATVLVAGFLLYLGGVTHEYIVNTWNQANAEAAVISQTHYQRLCNRVMTIYDSIPDEEKGDGTSEEYIAEYEGIRESEDFQSVLKAMKSLQNRNGPLNAFMVAIDLENNRMIYIVDADQKEDSTCKPGTWDEYPDDELNPLVYGRKRTILDRQQGVKSGVQAVFTNRPEYGPRCTAASTMYRTGNYTILVCVDEKLKPMVEASKFFLVEYVALLVVVTLLASYVGMRRMKAALVDPIDKLATAAVEYGDDENKKDGVRHFADLDIHTGDEIERLAVTLRDMETDVADYMNDLTAATAEKERLVTELALAAKIQMSVLPVVFPPFPDRKEFDLYASMEPAKGVGGDFYDMLMIDDDHLAVEIADVSGKGVPAALFMMISKIMLSDSIRDSMSPAEVLEEVNNRICEKNEEEMFVTVWLGILEISTGKLTTASAGHEYPVLVHADGRAEIVRDKHGFVIGGMEGMKYTDHVIQLEEGDSIFEYTDGVTEATSAAEELYGMDRMVEALDNAAAGSTPWELMGAVRSDIDDFIGDAEQFDDLTMLCLRYNGKKK